MPPGPAALACRRCQAAKVVACKRGRLRCSAKPESRLIQRDVRGVPMSQLYTPGARAANRMEDAKPAISRERNGTPWAS